MEYGVVTDNGTHVGPWLKPLHEAQFGSKLQLTLREYKPDRFDHSILLRLLIGYHASLAALFTEYLLVVESHWMLLIVKGLCFTHGDKRN